MKLDYITKEKTQSYKMQLWDSFLTLTLDSDCTGSLTLIDIL